jgi:uncharacterized protein YydD (DUF2326 family)
MMLRLHRLSSEPALFIPITFRSGINLILGEKSDGDSAQAKKVNGVGKSMSVDFIHFALLRDFAQTRISRIPKDQLPDGLAVILDLSINGETLQIRRSLVHPNEPRIIRNGQSTTFGNLAEATRFLSDLIFTGKATHGFTSFRSLMSLLMRDEGSEFSDILRTMPADRNAPGDPTPHLFLMGFDLVQYRVLLQSIKDLDAQTALVSQLKKDLTKQGSIPLSDIPAGLNQDEKEVKAIEAGLANLKAEPAFAQVEADLNEIEAALASLRGRRKGISYQIDQIRAMPHPEVIDETDLAIVYDRVRAGLGELVTKSLEQAKAFKAEVESFQRSLLNDELNRLDEERCKLTDQISRLSSDHADLVSRIDRKGTLKELSAGLSVAMHKQQDYYRRVTLYDQFTEADQRKEDLKSERQLAMDGLRKHLQDHKTIEASMNHEVSEIHQRIMGVANASFTLQLNTGARIKHPLDFELMIPDDKSHSIERTKVFIYDCALMFASCTQGRHPGFLVHDNIFDVDQDTLVQCLNYLQEKVDDGTDFQYILTLNREKIDDEERTQQIHTNITEARRALLTKAKPFLGFRYQELLKPR